MPRSASGAASARARARLPAAASRARRRAPASPSTASRAARCRCYRRLPKRGFNNIFAKDFVIVSLARLQQALDAKKLDAKEDRDGRGAGQGRRHPPRQGRRAAAGRRRPEGASSPSRSPARRSRRSKRSRRPGARSSCLKRRSCRVTGLSRRRQGMAAACNFADRSLSHGLRDTRLRAALVRAWTKRRIMHGIGC